MIRMMGFGCPRCGASYPVSMNVDSRGCPTCFDQAPANLRVTYDGVVRRPTWERFRDSGWRQSLWRYDDALPCLASRAISLGEGLTPLVEANGLGRLLGVDQMFVKDESRNPTWSHKDRFSTVAVSVARDAGFDTVATASSGNAGASLAAYAARAGLKCVVASFAGGAGPMLSQIRKYDASIVTMARKEDRWALLARGAAELGWFVTSPFHAPAVGSHPIGIEGYKTLAFELVEQFDGDVPDWCVVPVCYGDALSGLWRGFVELFEARAISRLPRLVAAEAHGSLSKALREQVDAIPQMPASFESLAISIGTNRSTYQALAALRDSNGVAVEVNNDRLIEMQQYIARQSGLFPELAAVTPFIALETLTRRGVIRRSDRVVAVMTSGGLKDIDLSEQLGDTPTFRTVDEAWRTLEAAEPQAV